MMTRSESGLAASDIGMDMVQEKVDYEVLFIFSKLAQIVVHKQPES